MHKEYLVIIKTTRGKKKLLLYGYSYTFKKFNKTSPFWIRHETCLIIIFYDNSQHFLRPCQALRPVKNQHFKMKFWNWGPIIILHSLKCVRLFSLQKTLHPIVHGALTSGQCVQARMRTRCTGQSWRQSATSTPRVGWPS